jgi:hypothetical protein
MGITIHHPQGDVKKITIDSTGPVSDTYLDTLYDLESHWRVLEWDLGTTEAGSSGAPLFNQNQEIIGDLTGGEASCDFNFNDFFAKISRSWDDFGPAQYQLKAWLDPDSTSFIRLPGYFPYDTLPSNLRLTPQGSGLKLNWNHPYNQGDVQYYVIERNGVKYDSLSVPYYTDNGVVQDVLYLYRVRARFNDGTYSDYSGEAVHVIWNTQSLPFEEDFPTSGDLPSGWYEHSFTGSTNWSISEGGYNNTPPSAESGPYNLLFQGSSGDSSRVSTPRIDMGGNRYVYLSLARAMPESGGTHDKLTVYVRFADSSSWHSIKTYDQSHDGWRYDTLYLPNPTSGYRLAFEGTSRGGGGIGLDNIQVLKDDQAFQPGFTANMHTFCAGETVRYSIDTLNEFEQYTWDFGYGASPRYVNGYGPHDITYVSPGPKTVQLTIDGVYQNRVEDLLMVDTVPQKPDIWMNEDTLFTDATGSVQWYFQDEIIPAAEDDTLIATSFGVYKVETTNRFGCSVFSDTLRVDSFDDIHTADERGQRMRVYPVPSGDEVYLEFEAFVSQEARLTVVNTLGAVVMERQLELTAGSNTLPLSISQLSAGLYLLRLRTQDDQVLTGTMIKK